MKKLRETSCFVILSGILLLTPWTSAFAGPIGVGVASTLQKSFEVPNKVVDANRQAMSVADWHLHISGVDSLNFVKGTFSVRGTTQVIGPSNVTGNGTDEIDIALDAVVPGGFKAMAKIQFVQETTEIKLQSWWTVKDAFGKTVRVPADLHGNIPISGFRYDREPDYIISNDTAEPFTVQGLQFVSNVPEVPIDELDLGSLCKRPGISCSPPEPDFLLAPLSHKTFFFPTIVGPGNFFYAQGTIFDPATSETSAFTDGNQSPMPEPSTLALFGIGLLGLVGYGWRQRKKAA